MSVLSVTLIVKYVLLAVFLGVILDLDKNVFCHTCFMWGVVLDWSWILQLCASLKD